MLINLNVEKKRQSYQKLNILTLRLEVGGGLHLVGTGYNLHGETLAPTSNHAGWVQASRQQSKVIPNRVNDAAGRVRERNGLVERPEPFSIRKMTGVIYCL